MLGSEHNTAASDTRTKFLNDIYTYTIQINIFMNIISKLMYLNEIKIYT